jgi:hypothetical protein
MLVRLCSGVTGRANQRFPNTDALRLDLAGVEVHPVRLGVGDDGVSHLRRPLLAESQRRRHGRVGLGSELAKSPAAMASSTFWVDSNFNFRR